MKISTYEIEAEVEINHWWFVGRRNLLRKMISVLQVPLDAPVLDIGTSTGTNLRLLKELGYHNYQGLDLSEDAIRWCKEKGLGDVKLGNVCNLPFPDKNFLLILATDIIEHVDDDLRALKEISRIMRSDGKAAISVPAFQLLWGLQDDVSNHKRRYLKKQLEKRINLAGMECIEIFYFNYILFIPILMARKIIKLFNIKLMSENQINTKLLNKLLTRVFAFDIWSSRYLHSPFGVSIMAIVKNK